MSNTEVWSTCEGCQDEITQIEALRFEGKCQACYLGISKQSTNRGTSYYTLLSAIVRKRKSKSVVEANIAFPGVGVVEVIIGVGPEGLQVIEIPSQLTSGSTFHIRTVIDEITGKCIDFTEVVEALRTNSIG
jgi:hypothetical protein